MGISFCISFGEGSSWIYSNDIGFLLILDDHDDCICVPGRTSAGSGPIFRFILSIITAAHGSIITKYGKTYLLFASHRMLKRNPPRTVSGLI
jgi:hypothetical protein